MVRTAGLEPARPFGQKILSLQRLPVPPRPLGPNLLPDRRERKLFGVAVQVEPLAHFLARLEIGNLLGLSAGMSVTSIQLPLA